MRHISLTVFIHTLCCLCNIPVWAQMPAPQPPFLADSAARQKLELKVLAFREQGNRYVQPSFTSGNKRIGVRETEGHFRSQNDGIITLFVNDKELFEFRFWGDVRGKGFGYPFQTKPGTRDTLIMDEAKETISYSKFYLLPDGSTSKFTSFLRVVGDNRLELTWDLGISPEKRATLPSDFEGADLWIHSIRNYRTGPLMVKGQLLVWSPLDSLKEKGVTLFQGKDLTLDFESNTVRGIHLSLPNSTFSISEQAQRDEEKTELMITTKVKEPKRGGKLLIDMGVTSVKKKGTPMPLAGVDFWSRDAMEVPITGVSNLLYNPSFEQGMRYWSWWAGGGPVLLKNEPKYTLSPDAKFGRHSLEITPGAGKELQSFPIPIKENVAYTLSFFAKTNKTSATLRLGVWSPSEGSSLTWEKALSTVHTLSTDWTRYSFTFQTVEPYVSILLGSEEAVWVDALQLEEGDKLTAFLGPAVEMVLQTSDEENMVAKGQLLDARFILEGAPSLKADLEIEVTDFFRENRYSKEIAISLSDQGRQEISLPITEEELGTGIFVVKTNFRLKDGRQGTDFYRFSIFDFLENKHPTKDLFGNLFDGCATTRADEIARNYMRWGWGSTTYGSYSMEESALLHKYRIRNFLMIVKDYSTLSQKGMLEQLKFSTTSITPALVAQIEAMSYQTVKEHPWGQVWALTTETECSPIIKKQNFQEWAKVQAAMVRGIRRANPNAEVVPDGGTAVLSKYYGSREIAGYLASTRGAIKWNAVTAHPYGNLDGVNGTRDLDVETARLLKIMKINGYGNETWIDYTEGFNVIEVNVPEWGTSKGKDGYRGGKPSYDFGWQEFKQAAEAARTYLMDLKYWPQLRSQNIWISQPYMDYDLAPLALCAIPNTLGHLFPKPQFVTDIQRQNSRAYIFKEGNTWIAALWCTNDDVENGWEKGPNVSIPSSLATIELIDLMGNLRKMSFDKDGTVLRLSPAPFFLRCTKEQSEVLLKLLKEQLR